MKTTSKSNRINVPLTLRFARTLAAPTTVEGEYDPATQQWTGMPLAGKTTWCRSSTTNPGWFKSDPDSDQDDESRR